MNRNPFKNSSIFFSLYNCCIKTVCSQVYSLKDNCLQRYLNLITWTYGLNLGIFFTIMPYIFSGCIVYIHVNIVRAALYKRPSDKVVNIFSLKAMSFISKIFIKLIPNNYFVFIYYIHSNSIKKLILKKIGELAW